MQTNGNKGTFTGGAKDFIVAKGNKEKKRKEKKEKSVGNECISNFESLDFSKLDGDLELFSRDKTN